jgi:prepilin-type N-terminal cleavage/methylation domain-containing protein
MRQVSRKAFTLIELLVVVSVIAILIGILIPTVSSSILRGQKVRAEGDVRRIHAAWKSYYNEYGHWPSFAGENISTGKPMDAGCVHTLTVRFEENAVENPKRIKFIELAGDQFSGSGTNVFVVDPWGMPYRVLFDVNYTGGVERTGFPTVYDNVIVWSSGRDTLSSTTNEGGDDLRSWK